mmetsp:Transcript_33217/g.37770  ORF Transcript_33217/g.37770 Transcript_33217/m.37770 type:complete len:451 (-) Transcript_33217:19-1371(-)
MITAIFLSLSTILLWRPNEPKPLLNNKKEFFSSSLPRRKWAYAFLLSGIESQESMRYRGALYNVMIATHILRESGSIADVVVMVQMRTEGDKFPDDDIHRLTALGIRIHYLPPLPDSNFYSIQFEKFNILALLKYSRVLYMDSDVMPLCNLDYLFDLSEPSEAKPLLKENVILAGSHEPCSGGFFMLRPKPGELERLRKVIRDREWKGIQQPWPHFDEKEGWGHVIESPDHWQYINDKDVDPKKRREIRAATNLNSWEWYGVFADQGLLYYWVKYFQKNVSIVIEDEIENWSSRVNGETVYLEHTIKNSTAAEGYNCGKLAAASRQQRHSNKYGDYVYIGRELQIHRDIVHFTGNAKPWLKEYFLGDLTRHSQLWFSSFNLLAAKYNIKDDITKWKGGRQKKVLMGNEKEASLFPTHFMMRTSIIKKFNISDEQLKLWDLQNAKRKEQSR